MIYKSHKIKLYPTKPQEEFFRKSCGVARFAHNWALERWQSDYKNGIKQSGYDLRKHLNSIKRKEFPWMMEVSKCAADYGVLTVEKAYKMFWKGASKYPVFKKKGRRDGFVTAENKQQFKQKDHKIWIAKLGWVKCAENLRFEGKVNSVTIKRTADLWFASIRMETSEDIPAVRESQTTVGIDLGIKTMMTLSDGDTIESSRALKRNMRRLRMSDRRVSKKELGGSNRRKTQARRSRFYYRINCIRVTTLHQATTSILKKYDRVIVEDLDVAQLYKNKGLSKHLNDVSFGEIRRQLEYKSKWMGKEVIIADRYYPSSKTCSGCGAIKEKLKLSERTYNCGTCGLKIDRDLNAARNLAAYRPTPKYGESHASGAITEALPKAGNTVAVNEEVELNLHT